MPFQLPDLPFAKDALAPAMSAETLEFHHGKHHKAYVTKTNELIQGEQSLGGASLIQLVREAKRSGNNKLFNNSAQLWNHSFFWQCLAPARGQKPDGKLAKLIEDGFGSADALLQKLQEEAVNHFSNGWAWLVLDRGTFGSRRCTMRTRRSCTKEWFRSSRSMCGSMLITSTIAMSGLASRRPCSRTSSTGISSRRTLMAKGSSGRTSKVPKSQNMPERGTLT